MPATLPGTSYVTLSAMITPAIFMTANGSLIITNQSALGADTSAIVVTAFNPYPGAASLRGFGGGSLVLDGTAAPIDITRNHSLGKDEARKRANEMLDRMKSEQGIKGAWNGDTFDISAPAISWSSLP